MKNTVFKIFIFTFLVLGTAGLTACNTVEGMGRDVESAGEAVQDAAD